MALVDGELPEIKRATASRAIGACAAAISA
jgi:anti-sigma factor RsiW